MNMIWMSRKYFVQFLILINFFDITYSHDNGNVTVGHRHGRVSGRIVKLYSGPKPDPILCVSEGFLADSVDCSVFYRCLKATNGKYTVYRFQCGPGTVYDPDTEVCNHPRSTKRSECGGLNGNKAISTTEKYIENEIDGPHKNNQELPSPISTKPSKLATSTPVKINSSYITTSYPLISTSKHEKDETTVAYTTSSWSIPTSKSTKFFWDYTPTKDTYHVTHQPSVQRGTQCTSDGFIGDSEDCRKFYRCVSNQRGGYLRYEFSCSESTIWDDDIQSCNHPWAVQRRRCGKGNSYDENRINYVDQIKNNEMSLDNSYQQQTQNSFGSKVTQAQPLKDNEHIVQSKPQINFGDRLNMERPSIGQNKTQINYGVPSSQSQTQFIYGNKETQIQLQDNSYISSQTQYISPMSGNTENTTYKYYTTTLSSTYSNEIDEIGYVGQNTQQEQEWPKSSTQTTLLSTATINTVKAHDTNCVANGFFGNINDCSKFYRCVENSIGRYTKYEYKCGDGTVWDPEIESCNHAPLVKSCSFIKSETNSTQFDNIAVSSTADNAIITTVSLIQTTTQKSIIDFDYVSGYQTIHKETPSPFTNTNKGTTSQKNDCRTSGFMGDSDCKKFYRCVENGKGGYNRYEFTCGEGTVWDSNIEACNHAWAVDKCGMSSITDNPITTSPTASQSNSDRDDSHNTNQDNDKRPQNTIKTTTVSSTTNVDTSVNNTINSCQRNGFMGNNNDCKIFYRCVENGNGGFIRYEFSCGEGTVWDPKISACNHIWAVEKCGGNESTHKEITSTQRPNFTTVMSSEILTQYSTLSSSSTTPTPTSTISDATNNQCVANGFIGDKNDCRKFYRCVENGEGSYIRYEFTCGEGTLWDRNIQACNHAWAVETCGSNVNPVSESTSISHSSTMRDEEIYNSSVTHTNQEMATNTTENNLWMSSTMKSSTAVVDSNKCSTDGFMVDYNDCKKFYRCVNDGKGSFVRYEFSCGDGTVWDSEINACNHVNSVKTPCSTKVTQSSTENKPDHGISSTSSEVIDYSTPSNKPLKSQQCEKEGFFGDKNDCKKFYRCTDNGQGGFYKYEFACGEGTIWDQEILSCNHASSNLQCTVIINDSQTDNPNLQSTTTTGVSQSTEKSQTALNKDQCNSEGFYANSNDCKKFFRCVADGKGSFIRYNFTCGEGTIWVQDIQACDHDTDISSCNKGSVTTTISTTSDSAQEKPITTTSTSTVSTTTERLSSTSSTKSTLSDEIASESTSTSSSGSTSIRPVSQDRCEETGYFGNTENCKMFYRCVDNGKGGFTKYDFTCGDGTIWDQDITACNHPQDVSNPSCEKKEHTSTTTSATTAKTTTAISNGSSKPTDGTSSTESSATESGNQNIQDGSTKKPNTYNYTCPAAGFYADPYDCKKFYRCVDWGNDGETFSIYHFECGEGTIWDPKLQTCNHEDSVYPPRNCNGTQTQNENTTTTTTTTTTKQEEITESSTAEPSTTIKQSTTQQTSTTESSSTSSQVDQTSTQQSSTSESSTTQSPSTTEQSTTQKSTTEESTTQKSTTEQSTTQKSTTEQSTTQQTTTTTDQTTVQQTTTTQQTAVDQTTTTTTKSTTGETTTNANEETTTTLAQTTTSESTTAASDQSTKTEQSTTQESNTEQTSENQSSTTEQSSTSAAESGQDTTTEQGSSEKECPETDDDQYLFVCPTGFRRHPKYCNLFYQCTEDDDSHEMKVAVFNCPNNTIYDESKTQCVEEDKADKKCDGEVAQRRRVKRLDTNNKEPITVGKDKYLCPAEGHFPFEKNEECSPVLFKCEKSKSGKIRGFIYQCPEGFVYWSISRRCESVSILPDCKRSLSIWNDRYEIPIERNNIARKAVK